MAGEHILIVDDEKLIQSTLRGVLEDEGYRVTSAGTGEEALALLIDDAPDLVFLDIWMPGMDGLEALAEMKHRRPETAVVMISGHATIETAVKATKLGAYDFIEKPLSLEKTLLVVARTLEHARLRQEHRQLRERVEREEQIAAGRFREDLFYRLNVIPIEVPSLRRRKEDIPALVEHFITLFSVENGRRPKTMSVEALAYFLSY